MDAFNLGIVALVGAGTRDGWRELLILFGGASLLVMAPLAVAWFFGLLKAAIPSRARAASGKTTTPGATRAPFIPSSW